MSERPRSSPEVSDGEEIWTCAGCHLDCPMAHRFCGVCGAARPENWYCVCGEENSPYHRFCVGCGREEDLGYEDLGLDAADEEAIEQTAARLAGDITIPQQGWDDVDDELTFAADSCVDVDTHVSQHKQPQQHQPARQDDSTAWACEVCTYVNENPLFMCCELCGSARPSSGGENIEEIAAAETKKGLPSRSDDASDDSSTKKKEKAYYNAIREQQKNLYERQHPNATAGQKTLPEPETDHELAMIYAQQERILAQYQQQQTQR